MRVKGAHEEDGPGISGGFAHDENRYTPTSATLLRCGRDTLPTVTKFRGAGPRVREPRATHKARQADHKACGERTHGIVVHACTRHGPRAVRFHVGHHVLA